MMRSFLLAPLFVLPFTLAWVFNFEIAFASDVTVTAPGLGTSDARKQPSNRLSTNRRVALIFGNANYQVGPLRNPVNDARSMARVLQSLGFEVILRTDSSLREMEDALDKFHDRIRQGSVGIFYYAGHGIQSGGENYLIPVNAKLRVEQDLRYNALPVGKVLGVMEAAKNGANIVILDACRDNPLARSWRSSQRGLAPIYTATGIYIAYATAPGSTAADGSGQNGTFTAALLRHIKRPHEGIDQLFNQVREDVNRETNGRQVPWTASSLIGNFSFYSTQRSTQLPANSPTIPINPLVPMQSEPDLESSPLAIPCPGSVCEGLPEQQ